ncbi:MAG: PPE domain-containing protein, partial [Actinophytocola sp.]|uniref:PPE domain-containing protein n=1 Tax=Actinophytocola sp. TaxID=1872138 RepID=UPI003D6A5FBC
MAPGSSTRSSDNDGPYQGGQYDPTRDPNSDYYIDRGDTSDTGTQVQQNAETTADGQETGDGLFAQVINIITRQNRVDTAYNQELSEQARQLAEGVNTRQPPAMMTGNYLSNPHPELKTMVTENVDPGAVGEMGDTWIEAGNAMTRFQSGVASAINNSESDWQGSAGNSARTFMAGVGNWVGNAGQSAQLAGTQTNLQASALAEAKRSMPDPVEFDVAAANRDLQTTTNPVEYMTKYNSYMTTYNDQQEAHQQAAQVVNTFDSSLATASTMPAFAPPPTMGGGDGTLREMGGDRVGSTGQGSGTFASDGGSNGSGSSSGGPGGGGTSTIPTPGGGGTGGGAGGPGGGGTGSGGPGSGTGPSGGGDFPGGGGFPPGGGTGPGGGQGPGGGNSNIPGGGAV